MSRIDAENESEIICKILSGSVYLSLDVAIIDYKLGIYLTHLMPDVDDDGSR